MTIPIDRPLTPEVLREYALRLENIENEYEKSGKSQVWVDEFNETLRNLDFEVFNMLDSRDVQGRTR